MGLRTPIVASGQHGNKNTIYWNILIEPPTPVPLFIKAPSRLFSAIVLFPKFKINFYYFRRIYAEHENFPIFIGFDHFHLFAGKRKSTATTMETTKKGVDVFLQTSG